MRRTLALFVHNILISPTIKLNNFLHSRPIVVFGRLSRRRIVVRRIVIRRIVVRRIVARVLMIRRIVVRRIVGEP